MIQRRALGLGSWDLGTRVKEVPGLRACRLTLTIPNLRLLWVFEISGAQGGSSSEGRGPLVTFSCSEP